MIYGFEVSYLQSDVGFRLTGKRGLSRLEAWSSSTCTAFSERTLNMNSQSNHVELNSLSKSFVIIEVGTWL
jgi:hypothetical protein